MKNKNSNIVVLEEILVWRSKSNQELEDYLEFFRFELSKQNDFYTLNKKTIKENNKKIQLILKELERRK